MCKCNDNKKKGEVLVGKGEFQIKDIYVSARVEVCLNIIQNVSFSFASRQDLCELLANQLRGQPLSKALSVTAKEGDPTVNHPLEDPVKMALLEAFHRAVEACLENE